MSGKLPPRKIAPRSGSGFGLGLALELGLGGNFPRGAIFLEPFYCAPSIVTVVWSDKFSFSYNFFLTLEIAKLVHHVNLFFKKICKGKYILYKVNLVIPFLLFKKKKKKIFCGWKLKISLSLNQFSVKYSNFEQWKGTGKQNISQFFPILVQILLYKTCLHFS